jgi:hypothetical protein
MHADIGLLINRTEFVEQSVTPMKVVDGKDALDPTLSRMYSTAKTKELVSYCMVQNSRHRPVSAETGRRSPVQHCKRYGMVFVTSDSLAAMYATMLNVPFYFHELGESNRAHQMISFTILFVILLLLVITPDVGEYVMVRH